MDITEDQIQQWRNARAQKAHEVIEAILKEMNCELQALPSIAPDGRIVAQIAIVPK